jgi:adenosylmethionine-8-amino-7-oxononanoate aminotransferase
MRERSDLFQHGHTYLGHPTACAAALAVQRVIKRDNLLENVNTQGQYLLQQLRSRFGEHEHIGDIRGRGLFLALEMVQDRETKATFDPTLKIHARIKQTAMEHGLMVYPMAGTIDGRNGDHVLIAPPFIVTPAQIDEIVDRLAITVEHVLAECLART